MLNVKFSFNLNKAKSRASKSINPLKTPENLFRYQRFDQGYVNNYPNYPISNHGGINVVSSLARVHGEG